MTLQDVVYGLIQLWDQKDSRLADDTFREEFANLLSLFIPTDFPLLGDAIKKEIIQTRQKSKTRALHLVGMLDFLASLTGEEMLFAIVAHARGFILTIDEKEYEKALKEYDKATKIYTKHQDMLRMALMNVTRIWALGSIGRYDEAFEIGNEAEKVLEEQKKWRDLANLYNNLIGIYVVRLKQYEIAETLLSKAQDTYELMGEDWYEKKVSAQINRAMYLRHLGIFKDSIDLNEEAIFKAKKQKFHYIAAQGEQTLGTTYFIAGHFNKGIELMENARETYLKDEHHNDVKLVDLSLSTGLLNLGRFEKVIEVSKRVIPLLQKLKAKGDELRATYNLGLAYLGLNQLDKAQSILQSVEIGFLKNDDLVGCNEARIGLATIYFRKNNLDSSINLAQTCIEFFQEKQLMAQIVKATLILGRSALAKDDDQLIANSQDALGNLLENVSIPTLTYQIHHFLGQCAVRKNDIDRAIHHYFQTTDLLDMLQREVITELRSDFLLNKKSIYEELVVLLLDNDEIGQALTIAERAKSRALLDLLRQRFSPPLNPRSEADRSLLESFLDLRQDRDTLYRSWQAGEYATNEDQKEVFQKIKMLEDEITSVWHQLLVRDSNYNQDRGAWDVYVDSAQPYLDEETAVLEYFTCQNRILLFLITKEGITAHWLDMTVSDFQKLQQRFWLNLNTVPQTDKLQKLLSNAQSLLNQAYQGLFAPVATICEQYSQLIIVPHGSLHYFPLHALYDGNAYLIENHTISYVPGSSFIGMYQKMSIEASGALVLGHSYKNELPRTLTEASMVANWLETQPFLETEATKDIVLTKAQKARIVHFAAHAEFHSHNPLFSGIELANEEMLTTLDFFNLTLNASLITLSACETGRGVVGGGDELVGLMRGLLAAGAASAVLTLWPVYDHSTEMWMNSFYRELVQNQQRKDVALQAAQLSLLNHEDGSYHHPFFWAPFFLVGANGYL